MPAAETGGGAADGRSTAGGDEGVRAVFTGALPVVVVGAAVDVALVLAVNPRLSSAESWSCSAKSSLIGPSTIAVCTTASVATSTTRAVIRSWSPTRW